MDRYCPFSRSFVYYFGNKLNGCDIGEKIKRYIVCYFQNWWNINYSLLNYIKYQLHFFLQKSHLSINSKQIWYSFKRGVPVCMGHLSINQITEWNIIVYLHILLSMHGISFLVQPCRVTDFQCYQKRALNGRKLCD